MAHHTHDPECPNCEEKLTQAHPMIVLWFRKLKDAHADAHISWSFRNEEEQNWAFEAGKSKARWPESRHNKTGAAGKPLAEALDLFRLSPAGVAIFPMSWYRQLADESKASGDPVEWGGTFRTIVDLDHFQLIELKESAPQTGESPSSSTS